WFYDRQFKVTEATLIPRPETEEWFHRYIVRLPERSLRVLDIGTGSGVLAVSHKLERPQDEVVAVDISEAALEVAKMNATELGADVTFCLSDMMSNVEGTFDLILSNPPYISQSERNVMDTSVLDFEPHIALFAEEEGLYFYRKIAAEAVSRLNPNGLMILEFGYKQGEKIRELFESYFPTAEMSIKKDFNQHDRTIQLKNVSKKQKEGEHDADSLS
ncbi:MAG: peptide chain release factor N(5)-glutamine methyltransferase, partial [Alkalibacterium sp.]